MLNTTTRPATEHPNAVSARVVVGRLASGPLDGGPGGHISFVLPDNQDLGISAWIDTDTGGLIVEVDTSTFSEPITVQLNARQMT